MKRAILLLWLCFLQFNSIAQSSNAYKEAAGNSMKTGDYENAILILKKGLEITPHHIELKKMLSFCYYFQNDFDKSSKILKKIIKIDSADAECYQILGEIYSLKNKIKESEILYRIGITKFPSDGNMYNQLAGILWEQKNEEAIIFWEKGIKADPNYSKNYYNACNYYYLKNNFIRSLIYGELFVNLESYTSKTEEIKLIIFNAYKKINEISFPSLVEKYQHPFELAYINNLYNQDITRPAVINFSSLMMLRTRFVLNWFDNTNNKFPYKLFNFHQQLLREGLFESYNQWLIGTVDSASHQHWLWNHQDEYNTFISMQKLKLFKLPDNQYYYHQ